MPHGHQQPNNIEHNPNYQKNTIRKQQLDEYD